MPHSAARRRAPRLRSAIAIGALAAGTLAAVSVPAHAAPARPADKIAALLRSMTLEEKIGQLFVTYAYGTTADTTDPAAIAQNQDLYGVDTGAQLVQKYHLGGVIYFNYSNTLADPATVATLSNGFQRAATTSGARIPLLTSIDQEGGRVVRLAAPAAVSPGNMAIGASFDPRLAYTTNRATGQQLRALGINVDDAPVVDTNTNPANAADGSRAFGDTAAQTSIFGAAAVLGLQSTKVAATAKHFPGLGSTEVNTDFGEAVSDQTKAEFERNDLPAFRAAVAAGSDEIMAAHIVAPALDPSGAPASLSKPMVTGILRDRLHYDGVVVTDALNAEALHDYTSAQRVLLALDAGVDQLLIPDDLPVAFQAVVDAVHSGAVTEQRIDRSVVRVLKLKQKLGVLEGDPQVDPAKAAAAVGRPEQLATMDEAAHRGITLYRNTARTLPLAPNSGKKVLVTGYGAATSTTLTAAIAAKGVLANRVYTGSAPTDDAIATAVAAARTSDYAVVISNDAWGDPQQRKLAAAIRATGTPTIIAATGAPYELGYAPSAPTFVASFGYQPTSLRALADVLFGRQPTGRSPVTVRTPDGSSVVAKLGSGLRY